MIAPLPNCFSIAATAAAIAFSFSLLVDMGASSGAAPARALSKPRASAGTAPPPRDHGRDRATTRPARRTAAGPRTPVRAPDARATANPKPPAGKRGQSGLVWCPEVQDGGTAGAPPDARPDLALPRRVPWPRRTAPASVAGLARYELRIYPVDAAGVEVRTTWTAPLAYRDGRRPLRSPGRGNAKNLAPGPGFPRTKPAPARARVFT